VHVKNVHIESFKRFADLTIEGLAPNTRLVVLCGPNGTGKSSVFDAFAMYAVTLGVNTSHGYLARYHARQSAQVSNWPNTLRVDFHESLPTPDAQRKRLFYFRTAYRHQAEFQGNLLQPPGNVLEIALPRMADADVRAADNYARLLLQGVDILLDDTTSIPTAEVREILMGELNQSLDALFGDIRLSGLQGPAGERTFVFDKGMSRRFDYVNLSGGEKAAFDILLDLVAKRLIYDDSVFCVDEPELHMNTRAQAQLLREMFRLTPPASQLWVATHSIGMMRAARDLDRENPNQVAFLDFEGLDFDQPVEVRPTRVTGEFWRRTLRTALGDLAALVAPRLLIVCEGSRDGRGARKEFDARCYRLIFEAAFPDVQFRSAGDAESVQAEGERARDLVAALGTNTQVMALIDRDDRTDKDVDQLRSEGVRVLSLRQLEAYLYDDEILTTLCIVEGKAELVAQVLEAKRAALATISAQGKPSDDLKSARGIIFNDLKRILDLRGRGNDADSFALQNLVPLIVEGAQTYERLRRDIFE